MQDTSLRNLRIQRKGALYALTMEQWLPLPPEDLFPFYADAGNLERITPSLLRFRLLTPTPIEMARGTRIDYELRLHGLPIRWTSEITAWDPPHAFCDEQRRGPYSVWRHTHTFREQDGGTLTTDRVDYAVPGGPLGPLVHRLAVRRDVLAIFRYRAQALEELFARGASPVQPEVRRSA